MFSVFVANKAYTEVSTKEKHGYEFVRALITHQKLCIMYALVNKCLRIIKWLVCFEGNLLCCENLFKFILLLDNLVRSKNSPFR